MSTKIYSGYRIKATSQDNLYKFLCETATDVVRAEVQKLWYKTAVDLIVRWIDGNSIGLKFRGKDKKEEIRPLRDAIDCLSKKDIWKSTVCISKPVRGHHLLIWFGNNKGESVFQSLPGVQRYGYWNNTDRPDEVTARQWKRRSLDWEAALAPSWVPGRTCLTYEFVSDGNDLSHWGSKEYLSIVPTFKRRLRKIAVDSLMGEVKVIPQEKPFEAFWDWMDRSRERRDYLETTEGKAEIVEREKSLEGKLHKTITYELINQPIPCSADGEDYEPI